MTCPACANPLPAGALACARCGALAADAARATTPLPACAGCGKPITDGRELCPSCRTERVPLALGAAGDDVSDDLSDALVEEDGEATGAGEGELGATEVFVGNRRLLGRLHQLVADSASKRQIHFALLVGPSGIGKSRLARELAEVVEESVADARVYIGAAGGAGSPPFAAYARLLAARFGIAADDTPAEARAKIKKGVEGVVKPPRAAEVVHLVSRLLGYPIVSDDYEPVTDAGGQPEARLFIALRRFFAADAARSPLLLVLDDMDRASPETVNLTHYLAAGLEGQPVTLLVLARPSLYEAHPHFGEGEMPLEKLEMGPLGPDECEQLLVELLRPVGSPPAALRAHAREQLGGLPRAHLELVRYLVDVGALRRLDSAIASNGASWRFDGAKLAETPLPTSLEALLAARLRVMAEGDRDLLEKAASCGEVFWLDAVVALVRIAKDGGMSGAAGALEGPSLSALAGDVDATRTEVAGAFARLERRHLITLSPHSSIPGEREYRFAYPPWWDVVYDHIDGDNRRQYHFMVAQWLELRPEGRGEEAQEEIGRHLERAGKGAAAGVRYRRAAEDARSRYFNDKAIRLYVQALSCVPPYELSMRIALWHDLGSVYQLKGDHENALSAFERMLRLTWLVSSRTKGAVALNKMGRVHRAKGELKLALEYLQRGMELFQQVGDERGVAGSLDDLGQCLWLAGRYDEALDRSASSLERRRKLGDKRSIATSLLNIGNIERHRGLFDAALSCYAEALELRHGLGDRGGVAACKNGLGMLAFQRGDLDGARAEWEEALVLAEEVGNLPLTAVLEGHIGELARATSNHAEAKTRFERAAEVAHSLDDRRLLSEATRNLGLEELRQGHKPRALELCTRALEMAQAAGIPVDVGRAYVALGEVHAVTLFDDTGKGGIKAEEYFNKAVDVFREIGNGAELGVALERFGSYYVERGDTDNGRKLLEEAQEIFSRLGMKAGELVERMIDELAD